MKTSPHKRVTSVIGEEATAELEKLGKAAKEYQKNLNAQDDFSKFNDSFVEAFSEAGTQGRTLQQEFSKAFNGLRPNGSKILDAF